jgi:sucrose-phosphate synthase
MLFSDIDGTLTGCADGARAFAAWRGANPQTGFAVATGRSVNEARRVLARWGLPAPDLFVTSVGSEIWRWDAAGRLVFCADYARHVSAGWAAEGVDRALGFLTAQSPYEQRPWKRSYLGTPADAEAARVALAEARLDARVIHSHGRFIDVLPLPAGKAAAILWEARRRGLAPEDCVVAGDSGNDADMLMALPRAVAPANALPEIAELAHDGLHRSARPHAWGVLDGMARLCAPLMAAE